MLRAFIWSLVCVSILSSLALLGIRGGDTPKPQPPGYYSVATHVAMTSEYFILVYTHSQAEFDRWFNFGDHRLLCSLLPVVILTSNASFVNPNTIMPALHCPLTRYEDRFQRGVTKCFHWFLLNHKKFTSRKIFAFLEHDVFIPKVEEFVFRLKQAAAKHQRQGHVVTSLTSFASIRETCKRFGGPQCDETPPVFNGVSMYNLALIEQHNLTRWPDDKLFDDALWRSLARAGLSGRVGDADAICMYPQASLEYISAQLIIDRCVAWHAVSLNRKAAGFQETFIVWLKKLASHRVISYSLYGPDLRYAFGALENVALARRFLPEWTCRFYVGRGVLDSVINRLRLSAAEIVPCVRGTDSPTEICCRLLVAADPNVSAYLVRDVDSRLSAREAAAVEEWLASDRDFHLLRDHPKHSLFPMLPGLWGGRKLIANLSALLSGSDLLSEGGEAQFLRARLWPLVCPSLFQHDAFSCNSWGGKGFPVQRVNTTGPELFVGGKFSWDNCQNATEETELKVALPEPCPSSTSYQENNCGKELAI